jgi:hypothetical protein
MKSGAVTIKLFFPEVTHITSAHISLSKAKQVATPSFKRCVPGKREEPEIPKSISNVYHNE